MWSRSNSHGAGGTTAAVPFRNRKFRIQNSIFKIKGNCLAYFGIRSDSGRSLRRNGTSGRELRASAAGRLRPAAPIRAQMQEGAIECTFLSGRSLRRDRTSWQRAAGLHGAKLRPANPCGIDFACGRATIRHYQKASPQSSGWGCTSGPAGREMQPSARGRLRAARSLRDRARRKIPHNELRLRAAGRSATEFDTKHSATHSSCRLQRPFGHNASKLPIGTTTRQLHSDQIDR